MTDFPEILNELPVGHYRNWGVLAAKDVGVDTNCESQPNCEKVRIMRLVGIRSDFLDLLEKSIGDLAGWGLWQSGSFRSFVIMFDPNHVSVQDDVNEDWMRLAWKVHILQDIIDSDSDFRECPAHEATELDLVLENLKQTAIRKSGRGGLN